MLRLLLALSLTFLSVADGQFIVRLDSQPRISWTLQTPDASWPGRNGYHNPVYDPVSQQTLFYISCTGTTTIYSSDIYEYKVATHTFTHVGGNCSADNVASQATSNTGSWPADRHPVQQLAVDTTRNVLWLFSGLRGGVTLDDLWQLSLNANPAADTWTKVSASAPAGFSSGAMVYDPDTDILFYFGYDGGACSTCNKVYCPSASLSAAQTTAGCTAPQAWATVSVAGGVMPDGWQYPVMLFNPVTHKVMLFGGRDSGNTQNFNDIWEYTVATKTWLKKVPASAPPPLPTNIDSPPTWAWDVVPSTGRILYHQTHGTGAPKDWEFDPQAVTWTALLSTGGGPTAQAVMRLDASTNTLVSHSRNAVSGALDLYHGRLNRGY